jgi:hypothetical protein
MTITATAGIMDMAAGMARASRSVSIRPGRRCSTIQRASPICRRKKFCACSIRQRAERFWISEPGRERTRFRSRERGLT